MRALRCGRCGARAEGVDTEGWILHTLERREKVGPHHLVATRRLVQCWTCSIDCAVEFYSGLTNAARLENARKQLVEKEVPDDPML